MIEGLTAEDALKAEEKRYAHFRHRSLGVPDGGVIRVSRSVRSNIRYRILRYYWMNPRGHAVTFDQAPEIFSKAVGRIIADELPKASVLKIGSFAAGNELPFLVIRNVLSVPMGFPKTEYRFREIAGDWESPVRRHCQRQMRTIDSTLGGFLSLLGTEPTHRFASIHRCGYDLTTRWDVQEAFDAPQPDMPLRFHQSTVERPLPRNGPDTATTALYAAYGAIRNPRRVPIYLLPVDTVIDALRSVTSSTEDFDDTINTLGEQIYNKEYPRLSQHVYQFDAGRQGEPILVKHRNQYAMSFDSSLVWVSRPDQRRGMEAINKLRIAIEQASWEHAYEIKLRRHDILLVDNLRALVARSEETPAALDLLALPAIRDITRRWLREMHGFAHRAHEHPQKPASRRFEIGLDEENASV